MSVNEKNGPGKEELTLDLTGENMKFPSDVNAQKVSDDSVNTSDAPNDEMDIDDLDDVNESKEPGEVVDGNIDAFNEINNKKLSNGAPFVIPQVVLDGIRQKVDEHLKDFQHVSNAFQSVKFNTNNGGLIAKSAFLEARRTLLTLIESEYVSCMSVLFVSKINEEASEDKGE